MLPPAGAQRETVPLGNHGPRTQGGPPQDLALE